MLDLFHEIGQTLSNNRLRTFLTGIAVAWGIFMLIVLLGAARGVFNSFESEAGDRGNNRLTIWGGMTSIPYKGYKDGRWISLRTGDIDAIRNDNRETVSSVIAYASVDTAKISTERDYLSDGFEAVYPEAQKTDRVKMKYGRFINGRDIAGLRKVIILHEKNARLLFGNDSTVVGRTVRSMGLAWTVAGVYEHPWRSQSYAPYTTLKALTGNDDEAYQLDVTVEGLTTEEEGNQAEDAIRGTLAKTHEFDPKDRGAVYVWNQFTSYLTSREALGYLELAMWVIGIFTLLSGIVGVSNIMFVSVRERTHEIGIRRAIGAKPRSILTQIVTESIAITTLFGYIGIVLGMVVLEILSTIVGDSEGFKDPSVDIATAVRVTIALIIAGSLAGLFPAIKATKVKPVEALRDE